jgi:hypothetical protein
MKTSRRFSNQWSRLPKTQTTFVDSATARNVPPSDVLCIREPSPSMLHDRIAAWGIFTDRSTEERSYG